MRKFVAALHVPVGQDDTLVMIGHNLEVIKTGDDHIIDLGPEGGDDGGYIVATGTPEEVAATPGSYNGAELARDALIDREHWCSATFPISGLLDCVVIVTCGLFIFYREAQMTTSERGYINLGERICLP